MNHNVHSADLFEFSKPIEPLIWIFLVNRIQTLYSILFFPGVLIEPSMIWIILLAAVCSHLNILLMAGWLRRKDMPDGCFGTVRLFGKTALWLFSLLGLSLVLVKCAVFILGYVDILKNILFPSLNPKLFVVLLLLACLYLARLGLGQALNFGVIAFIGTIWVVLIYVLYIFPANADYYHLLPLIPERMLPHPWHVFITVWAAFAGPEYLLMVPKQATDERRIKSSLLIGNALTAIEFVFFFVIVHLFYGSQYLRRLDLPVVQLIRYIHLPFAERLEMMIIPAYAFSVIYVVTFLLLYAAAALQIVTGSSDLTTGRKPLWPAFVLLLTTIIAIQHWGWRNEIWKNNWIEWNNWLNASTYTAMPVLLIIASFLIKKRGTRHAKSRPAD